MNRRPLLECIPSCNTDPLSRSPFALSNLNTSSIKINSIHVQSWSLHSRGHAVFAGAIHGHVPSPFGWPGTGGRHHLQPAEHLAEHSWQQRLWLSDRPN